MYLCRRIHFRCHRSNQGESYVWNSTRKTYILISWLLFVAVTALAHRIRCVFAFLSTAQIFSRAQNHFVYALYSILCIRRFVHGKHRNNPYIENVKCSVAAVAAFVFHLIINVCCTNTFAAFAYFPNDPISFDKNVSGFCRFYSLHCTGKFAIVESGVQVNIGN